MRFLFGSLVGSVSGFDAVPLPSISVRICYPHDLDLPFFATTAVVPEVGTGSGGLRVGSDLLLYDGNGDGILLLVVSLREGVYGRLVSIHP